MTDLIDRRAVIDALHTWFRDGFDEDKWWNSTHVLAAIEGLPSAQQGYKWETCFECPLSHGCPKIKGCTNEQAIEYASQIPNDCPLSTQSDHVADVSKKVDGDDCVSRRDAIDAMKDMYRAAEKWLCDATDDVTKARAESCMASLVEIKLRTEKLPAAQPETQWIPCSERLPVPKGHVPYLITEAHYNPEYKGRYVTIDWYDARDPECPPSWDDHGTRDGVRVIAWMPLPEPYRGGDKE